MFKLNIKQIVFKTMLMKKLYFKFVYKATRRSVEMIQICKARRKVKTTDVARNTLFDQFQLYIKNEHLCRTCLEK